MIPRHIRKAAAQQRHIFSWLPWWLRPGGGGAPQRQERPPLAEYQYNVGLATRTLVDDLPFFFETGLTRREIYARHICLSDPFYFRTTLRGRGSYEAAAAALRAATRSYFGDIAFDILRVHQIQPPEPARDGEPRSRELALHIRWIFVATPRHSLLLWALLGRDSPPRSTFEGLFEYQFDEHGRISAHRILSIHPSPWQFWVDAGLLQPGGRPSLSSGASPVPPVAPFRDRLGR